MRCIGLDIHRDFCEVAIAEGGRVRSAGALGIPWGTPFTRTGEGIRPFRPRAPFRGREHLRVQ